MTYERKKCMILLIIVALCLLLSIGIIANDKVYAEAVNFLSAEKYTESDCLLNSDGTQNPNRKIQDFAKEAKIASFVDLGSVIPLQYLESQEENAVFAYNGKEYGEYN